MKEINFQTNAIERLLKYTINNFEEDHIDITFSSPVGSGKTMMLGKYMNELPNRLKAMGINENIAFIWISPGKGKLDEQSKKKIYNMSYNIKCILLADLLNKQKIDNLDAIFTDWQKINSDNNIAWRSGDFNGLEYILNSFVGKKILLIDEAHDTSSTEISQSIIEKINPFLTIYVTATPKNIIGKSINVPIDDVIREELIKKAVSINEDVVKPGRDTFVDYIIKRAIDKRNELENVYRNNESNVKPLCLIQIENDSSMERDNPQSISNCEKIKEKLCRYGVVEKNIATWLAGEHSDNLKDIQENDVEFLIFKEAVALGWDCPRAQLLIRLRETSSIIFDIQTIGRIMRMPELHHYKDESINKAYIYTDDDNFEYNSSIDEQMQSKIRTEKNESFIKEKYMEQEMLLKIPMEKNIVEYNSYVNGQKLYEKLLEVFLPVIKDFNYDTPITKNMVEGIVATEKFYEDQISIDSTREIKISDKDIADRFYYYIKKLYPKFNLSNYLYVIAENQNISRGNFRKMFLLNKEQISLIIKKAIAEYEQENLKNIIEEEYSLPKKSYFIKYLENQEDNNYLYNKLPDFNYLYEKEIIQEPEYKFNKYLLANKKIKMWLKNGDLGDEYFSIVYDYENTETHNIETKAFYPDYICLTEDNKLLILEIKGLHDIDKYTANKYNAIKPFMEKHMDRFNAFKDVIFSVVRFIEDDPFILMKTDKYISDISDNDHWKKLNDII